jgi:hypothetical protein
MTRRFLSWMGSLPTTNARIAVTLLCTIATCARVVLAREWHPDPEWLVFLASMSGIDVLQFSAKRVTDATHTAARQTATHPAPGGQP